MRSGDLKQAQIAALSRQISPALNYFRALHDRMKARGFSANDPLFVRVFVTLDALDQLKECLDRMSLNRTAQGDYMKGMSSRR